MGFTGLTKELAPRPEIQWQNCMTYIIEDCTSDYPILRQCLCTSKIFSIHWMK